MTNEIFVLIHSPLVGPFTWALAADELRQMNAEVVAPALQDVGGTGEPYWKRHVASVTRALMAAPVDRALILVAHSGAGPLLPPVRQATRRSIAAYLFVDAVLPEDGASRLDLMAQESAEMAEEFRQALASGARFPAWGDSDLAEVIPDAGLRRRMLTELRPRPLAFFEEPLPVFEDWPDAPCGYLKFSSAYAPYAALARSNGWACRELPGGHFHMLVSPRAVARELVNLRKALG